MVGRLLIHYELESLPSPALIQLIQSQMKDYRNRQNNLSRSCKKLVIPSYINAILMETKGKCKACFFYKGYCAINKIKTIVPEWKDLGF